MVISLSMATRTPTSVYMPRFPSHVDGNISVSYNAKLRSLALYNVRTIGGGYYVTRNTYLQSASLNRLTSLGYMMQLYGNSSLRNARFPALGASPSTQSVFISRYNYQLSHCDTENLRQTLTSLTYTTVSNTRNDTVDLYRDNDRDGFGKPRRSTDPSLRGVSRVQNWSLMMTTVTIRRLRYFRVLRRFAIPSTTIVTVASMTHGRQRLRMMMA